MVAAAVIIMAVGMAGAAAVMAIVVVLPQAAKSVAVVAVVAAFKAARAARAVLIGVKLSREKSENSEKFSGWRVIIAPERAPA